MKKWHSDNRSLKEFYTVTLCIQQPHFIIRITVTQRYYLLDVQIIDFFFIACKCLSAFNVHCEQNCLKQNIYSPSAQQFVY
jgi:hypothetical protein